VWLYEKKDFRLDVNLVVKGDGTIVFASSSAPTLFNARLSDLIGGSVFDLMPARIRTGQKTLWAMLAVADEPMRLDAVGLRNDDEFPLLLEVSVVESGAADGETMYCVAMQDGTPSDAESRHAQKMEALGLLAGGVAHDFNNTLTTIMGLAQAVKEDLPEGDPLIEDVKEILQAATSAGQLTQQLLSFARRRPSEAAVIELNRSVSDIDKILRRTLPASIALTVESAKNKLQVQFPPSDLHHILINLATNAKDAMPEGGSLTLTLDTCKVEDDSRIADGEYAIVSLRDSGTGIPEESLAKIFDPFYSTKGEHGTGLGLSTCFGLAKQGGGSLSVSSEIGVGSVFTLYMPMSATDAIQPLTTTEGTRIRRHKGVALIVEDESSIRKYMKRTVIKSGLTTLVASSAEEAIRLANSLVVPPELLVSDIVLPGESGTELAVKLHSSFPDLKILLTSGRVDGIGSPEGLADADTAFLPKPFTAKQLRKHIEQLMNPPSRKLEGTILLIEPDGASVKSASETFSALGLTTIALTEATEARQFLQTIDLPPALILLSLSLPNDEAQDILESIRERPLTAEIPIVLLESVGKKYALVCGNHTSVISSPITDEKLNRALERVGLTLE
jgi:signal transduction histidine kinase/CheY-like chemotaxis protein